MIDKSPLCPERVRTITGSFAFFRCSRCHLTPCASLPDRLPVRSTWRKPTPPRSGTSSATLWEPTMIDPRTICEIHRLAHAGLSVRKIAKTLGISRQTTST